MNITEYLAEQDVDRAHLVVLESEAVDRGITRFAQAQYPARFDSISRVLRPSQKDLHRRPRHWLAARRRFLQTLQQAISAAGTIDVGVFGHGAEIYAGAAYRLAGRPPVVIVDDGTDTYRFLTDTALRARLRRGRAWNLKRLLFRSDLRFVDRAQFYTLVAPERVEGTVNTRHNRYDSLRATLTARPIVQQQHIIGQHLVEIDAMSAADYRAQIMELCSAFPGPSCYFPHPGETEDNLRCIETIPGLEIARINEPYELFFLRQDTHPCRLSSFCTTAFITLSSWLADPRIAFLYIDARPLLTRSAIVERARFAYDFTADNPYIRLLPPLPPDGNPGGRHAQATVSSATEPTTASD